MRRAFQANVHPCVTWRGVCRLTLLPLGLDGNCSCGKLSSLYALKTEVLFCLIWLLSVDCDGIAWVCKWKIFFLFHMPVSPRVSCFSSLSLEIFCSWPLVVSQRNLPPLWDDSHFSQRLFLMFHNSPWPVPWVSQPFPWGPSALTATGKWGKLGGKQWLCFSQTKCHCHFFNLRKQQGEKKTTTEGCLY